MMYGLVRCSTRKQEVLAQVDALKRAGCQKIFKEKAVSGAAKKRPVLAAIEKVLRPGDVFVVTAIDRGFRDTRGAISFLDDVLTPKGVTFVSLRERLDTRTPEGRRWYMIEAAEAEYERAKISIRTREAMQALKRRGRKFGRRRKLTKDKIARARAAVRNRGSKSMDQIARRLRISRRSLFRALQP